MQRRVGFCEFKSSLLYIVCSRTPGLCRETLSHKIGKTNKQKNIDKSKVWHLNKKTGLDPLFYAV